MFVQHLQDCEVQGYLTMEGTKVWDYSAVFHSNLQGATILEQEAVAGTADGCFTLENDGTEKLCSRFGTEKTSSHPEG